MVPNSPEIQLSTEETQMVRLVTKKPDQLVLFSISQKFWPNLLLESSQIFRNWPNTIFEIIYEILRILQIMLDLDFRLLVSTCTYVLSVPLHKPLLVRDFQICQVYQIQLILLIDLKRYPNAVFMSSNKQIRLFWKKTHTSHSQSPSWFVKLYWITYFAIFEYLLAI